LVRHKAAGFCGWTADHIKFSLKTFPNFADFLTDLFNQILQNPDIVLKMKEFYKFRVIFIPKGEDDWR